MMTDKEQIVWREATSSSYFTNENGKQCTDDEKRKSFWLDAGLSLDKLVEAFIEMEEPDWKDLIKGDKIKLSTETDNEKVYEIDFIDYQNDVVVFKSHTHTISGTLEPRAITRFPHIEVIERIPRPKNIKSLF